MTASQCFGCAILTEIGFPPPTRPKPFISTSVDDQESGAALADCIDRQTPPEVPPYCKVAPGVEAARRIVSYAHKLSYTTFAPLGYEAGRPLGGHFRPPAPQEGQMRSAQLHQFAGEMCRVLRRVFAVIYPDLIAMKEADAQRSAAPVDG